MYQLHTEQIILELSTGQLAQVINPVWPGHPYLRLGGEKNGGSRCGCLCCGWTAVLLCSPVFFSETVKPRSVFYYRFYGAWLAETKKATDGQGIY